jgi:hypothetical protein
MHFLKTWKYLDSLLRNQPGVRFKLIYQSKVFDHEIYFLRGQYKYKYKHL